MKQRPRIYYSASQRTIIWDRWRKGDTIHQIAGLFDRFHSSIHRILAETGGIRPPERHRSRSALTLTDREEISRGLVAGSSIRSIAASLGRAPSTISREIRRNNGLGAIEPVSPTRRRGTERVARSSVNWCRTERWLASWPASSALSGRRNRLPAGSSVPTPMTKPIRCHTRPSIAACSSRPAVL